uniref:Endonuclease/exonuclease/phosphatase domain-containing protein n=1 Tax=Lotus japonicus TaxID=34305 RepID=I3SXV3_LOTJA|nr:unknown [Lotus japonicus]
MPEVIVAGDFNSTPEDKVYQCLISVIQVIIYQLVLNLKSSRNEHSCMPRAILSFQGFFMFHLLPRCES